MIFSKNIKVGNKEISQSSPVFIIAEAGVNHGGDISVAKNLIDVAVEANADAVKFQTFRTESLILKNIEKAPYQKENTGNSESQFEMLKKLEVTKENNLELKEYCKRKNIIFLTTPFDEYSLDELDEIDLPAYKISSTDLTNLPFLERVAKKQKPIFLSTGMSYLSEVALALETINNYNDQVVLMQCTANYPIEDSEANLNVLNTYKDNFDLLLGYSDHTVGMGASLFAVPMGVKTVEKHFTLKKDDIGPDHKASLSPSELNEYVKKIRQAESFLGASIKKPNLSETYTRKSLQKCLVAKNDINKGEIYTKENIIAKRTGGEGISPIYYYDILGKEAPLNILEDELIK